MSQSALFPMLFRWQGRESALVFPAFATELEGAYVAAAAMVSGRPWAWPERAAELAGGQAARDCGRRNLRRVGPAPERRKRLRVQGGSKGAPTMPGTHFDVFGNLHDPNVGSFEEKSDEFYMLIGKCIKAWAYVEDRLFELYVLATAGTREANARKFFNLPGAGARLAETDAALRRASLGADPWETIRSSIKAKLNVRNLVAHSPVRKHTNYTMYTWGKPNRTESWMEVAISENERLGGKTDSPVRDTDLSDHLAGVERDGAALDAFYGTLAAGAGASRR